MAATFAGTFAVRAGCIAHRRGTGSKKAWQLPSQERSQLERVVSPVGEALVARRHGSYLRRSVRSESELCRPSVRR